MTTPTVVPPSKAKVWVALAGSLLAFIIPLVVSVSGALPGPYPAIIGAIVAILTALGVYHAPYKPPATVIVPESQVAAPSLAPVPINTVPTPNNTYRNPWQE